MKSKSEETLHLKLQGDRERERHREEQRRREGEKNILREIKSENRVGSFRVRPSVSALMEEAVHRRSGA